MTYETIETVAVKLALKVVTNLCSFGEFMVKKYILTWCGIEMSFVRMLTFGICMFQLMLTDIQTRQV